MYSSHSNSTDWSVLGVNALHENVTVILENDDCKVLRISGQGGNGIVTIYQVFPGVYLMYNDFHMTECLSMCSLTEPMLCIDHCRDGRLEIRSEHDATYYVESGDMRINNLLRHTGACFFPLSHYHGITIAFHVTQAETALKAEMPGFSFNLPSLAKKFCNDDQPFVIHGESAVDHLFYQLYQLPGRVQKDYFKVKVVELLLYLSGMEVDPYKVDRPYFYAGQVEKIRAIHDLITSDLTRTYTAEELSQRFSIGLTTMKRCFKSIYGSPIYHYLKQYRLHHAATLLISRPDLKVSEIGSMVGYDSASKFTAVFHAMMGETPLEYRRNHGMTRKF